MVVARFRPEARWVRASARGQAPDRWAAMLALAAESWSSDMIEVTVDLEASDTYWTGFLVAVRRQVRAHMRARMARPTAEKLQPWYRAVRTCQRHGHQWVARYHDGRDLAHQCRRCGEAES